jgi:hypothetical protein
MRPPLFRSFARPLGRSGQFIPITAMVLFSGVMLMVAGANIYIVTKAKLQVQNMADAAALAIAALEAKEINVVVDRDEWLNHMYPAGTKPNSNQLPRISDASKWNAPNITEATSYAQLVATINKAQSMFIDAYTRFMGADTGTSTLGNSGAGALADILGEIDGLKDPSVTVVVYNTSQGPGEAEQQAANASQANQGNSAGGAQIVNGGLQQIPIKTEDITLASDGQGNKNVKLSKILGLPQDDNNKIGWMRPVWESGNMTPPGQSKPVIGAGAVVVKRVQLLFSMPLFRTVNVTARSTAYVVQNSGLSVQTGTSSIGTNPAPPTTGFRPTYYVKLGSPS